ncbi:MAG: hypothetical protein KAR20_15555, partial [Candidatus Heimdallarchaeota archaeon]|nr:hypothetical protein [Candidatus Heimdallarchaeota archaeon]
MDFNQFVSKKQQEKKQIKDLAYQYFGKITTKYLLPHMTGFDSNIKKSGMKIALMEYLSLTVGTSFIVLVIQIPLLSIIFGILLESFLLGILIGLFGGIISALGIFALFYIYPSIFIGERKKDINGSLPFATLYLATMAGGGTPPIAMFRTLSRFDYGEITKECKTIVEETDIIGLNITNSLKNSAERSPSQD